MEGITQQILLHLIPVCSNSIHLLGDQKYSRLQDSCAAWAPALQEHPKLIGEWKMFVVMMRREAIILQLVLMMQRRKTFKSFKCFLSSLVNHVVKISASGKIMSLFFIFTDIKACVSFGEMKLFCCEVQKKEFQLKKVEKESFISQFGSLISVLVLLFQTKVWKENPREGFRLVLCLLTLLTRILFLFSSEIISCFELDKTEVPQNVSLWPSQSNSDSSFPLLT